MEPKIAMDYNFFFLSADPLTSSFSTNIAVRFENVRSWKVGNLCHHCMKYECKGKPLNH